MKLKIRKCRIYTLLLIYFLFVSFCTTSLGVNDRFKGVCSFILYFFASEQEAVADRSENLIISFSFIFKILLGFSNIFLDHAIEPFLKIADSFKFRRYSVEYYKTKFLDYQSLYVHLLNAQYHITGSSEYISIFINIILTSLSAILFLKILNSFDSQKKQTVKNLCLFLVSFSPYVICYSIILQRESLYFFFVTYSLFYFTDWIFKNNFISFVKSLFLSLLATLLHDGHITFIFSYSFIYTTRKKERNSPAKIFVPILLSIILFSIISGTSRNLLGSKIQISDFNVLYSIRKTYWSRFSENGGSRYLSWMNPPINWLQFFLYTPLRMIYFLFSPLPTEWRGAKDVVSFFADSSIHIYGIYCILYSLSKYKNVENRVPDQIMLSMKSCACIILFMTIIFSWGTAAAGTAIRHRLCLIPVECIAIFLKYTYFY